MDMSRLEILQKIESGELGVEEGSRLLNALDETVSEESQSSQPDLEPPEVKSSSAETAEGEVLHPEVGRSIPPNFKGFRKWSWILFGVFLLLTVISAWWMVSAWQNHPFGFGFWLSWIPFIIGILGMASSASARWLHVRVRDKGKSGTHNIRISLPLPLGMMSWIFKANPSWLPAHVREMNIGDMMHDVDQSISHDQPFYVEVDDGDDHVEVYIG